MVAVSPFMMLAVVTDPPCDPADLPGGPLARASGESAQASRGPSAIASAGSTVVSTDLAESRETSGTVRPTRVVMAFAALALMTLGEVRLLDRLLYRNAVELDFVASNMAAIRAGRPAFRAWQHRILAPALIAQVSNITGSHLESVKLFSNLMWGAANLLLFWIMRRKGANLPRSVLAVAVFGFVHLLILYKLEYPWDGIDVLLFLVCGYWAARQGSLLWLTPILLIGTFNHETVLYVPAWYLLSTLDPARRSRRLRQDVIAAALGSIVIVTAIAACRHFLFVGGPDFGPAFGPESPGQTFEAPTPFVSNNIHIRHNLQQLLVEDWRHGRAFMNAGIVAALLSLIALGLKAFTRDITALAWSALVVATIFCFGYQSETRLYLPLVAFWFAYAFPSTPFASEAAHHRPRRNRP
jgi:hypothetical protein